MFASGALALVVHGAEPQVEVGPNVRVSEPGVSHVEPYIAAHPTDVGRLVIVGSHDDGRVVVAEGFVSSDGGRTWSVSRLPDVAAFGLSVDNYRRVFPTPVEGDGVAVLVSIDSARSFTRLAFITPDNLAHQAYVPVVLPNGTLLIPYIDYPIMTHDELAATRRDPAQARFNTSRLYVGWHHARTFREFFTSLAQSPPA